MSRLMVRTTSPCCGNVYDDSSNSFRGVSRLAMSSGTGLAADPDSWQHLKLRTDDCVSPLLSVTLTRTVKTYGTALPSGSDSCRGMLTVPSGPVVVAASAAITFLPFPPSHGIRQSGWRDMVYLTLASRMGVPLYVMALNSTSILRAGAVIPAGIVSGIYIMSEYCWRLTTSTWNVGRRYSSMLNVRLLATAESEENESLESPGFAFSGMRKRNGALPQLSV